MRRGLMAWDENELPLEALKRRVARLQSVMNAAAEDALLVYTNFIRSGAVSYLTAFSPYWADGVLLVPNKGEPVFATTLSKRVGSWIQSVKPIGDLINSPTPGAALARRLDQLDARRVAILERDAFPSGLYNELSAALPKVTFVDGTDTYALARRTLDSAERRLLQRADEIARSALDSLRLDDAANVGAAVAIVEKYARLQGAEEVYVAIAPDLDSDRRFVRQSGDRPLGQIFAIRATVAYKGAWVRNAKTYARDDNAGFRIARIDAWFQNFAVNFAPSRSIPEQIAAGVETFPGARLVAWMAESAVGTRPLAVVASSRSQNGNPVPVMAPVITLELVADGVPWCAATLAGLSQDEE
jgi:creatinase/prolidase-like protein